MGCSPSTLPAPSSASAAGQTGERGSLPLDASEKDESRLFCIKLRRSRLRRCSCGNVTLQPPSDGNGSTAGDNLCGQVLLNPLQTKSEADYEKVTKSAGPPFSSRNFVCLPPAEHRQKGLDCNGGRPGQLYTQRGATGHRQ